MIIIRKAKLDDVPLIAGLWSEFMRDHDGSINERNENLKPYTAKKDDAEKKYREHVQENMESGTGAVFIAEINGDMVGFTLLIIKDEIPIFKIEKLGHFSDLFVKSDFRGRGIGTKLRDEAIKWFKEKGVEHISILLYNDNEAAHSLYKKWDFFDYKIEMRKKL